MVSLQDTEQTGKSPRQPLVMSRPASRTLVKRDQFEKNIGWRVKLAPAPIHLDAIGRELPARDIDWIIVQVTDDELRLDEAAMTDHQGWHRRRCELHQRPVG